MTEAVKDAERLVRVYRKIREAKEAATSAYKKRDGELKAQLDTMERLLLDLMNEQEITGLRTAAGSVSKQIKERFWSTDWDEFKKFIREHDALDLYEHRIAQKNMSDFLKEHPTDIPPGLQIDRRYAVVVTKPRGTGGDEDE